MAFDNYETLQLHKFAQKLFAEIKAFDETVSAEFDVVATIGGKKFVLENVSAVSDGLLIFSGHEFDSDLPVKIFVNNALLQLMLSVKPRQREQKAQPRSPIGFLTS